MGQKIRSGPRFRLQGVEGGLRLAEQRLAGRELERGAERQGEALGGRNKCSAINEKDKDKNLRREK